MAMTALTTIKTATKTRMSERRVRWLISFFAPPIRSSVSVEAELMTNEESVLIEAETTSTRTSAISMAGRLSDSMAGITES